MEFNEAAQTRSGRSFKKLTIVAAMAVAVAIAAVVTTGIVIIRYGTNPKHAQSAQQTGTLSNDEVAHRVSAVFAAPNEKPSVAQIADKSKLTSPFFQYAQAGDYVLIYPKAKIAVIFRSTTNRLINAGPIATN